MALSVLNWPALERAVPAAVAEPTVIVGAGPAGMRVAAELLRHDPRAPLVIYGDEPWEPYQRVQLTALAMGEIGLGGIANPLVLAARHRVIQRYYCRVTSIDRSARAVSDIFGRWQPYARLVLAVGSRPHIPDVPGMDKVGVYTFRDLSDVQRLLARRARSRLTVVLGGGLLGVEAARALRRAGTEVTLLHHAGRLMNRQLDAIAAQRLRDAVERLGIRVQLNDSVAQVLGSDRLDRLQLRSGAYLACDTLVVAAGIRPNTELALEGGLSVGRGIRVDDQLRTSDPFIYAVGECVEHRGHIAGLVAPGLEQAAVVAHHLSGGDARYAGTLAGAQLKVIGLSVASVGETGDDESALRHRFAVYAPTGQAVYRKLILRRNRLVGAIAIGEWDEWSRVQELVLRRRLLLWWGRRRFEQSGRLAVVDAGTGVACWPAAATVCQCAAVSRGTLTAAMAGGSLTLEALSASTSAGRICGSCRPLLAQLLGAQAAPISHIGRQPLIAATVVALLVLVTILMPYVLPHARSVQGGWTIDTLWQNGFWKQVSGYTLLALAVLGLSVSLRKRVRRVTFGEYAWWRVAHALLGGFALAVLVAHTGLRFGQHLNLYLMVSFVALAVLGSTASAIVAWERRPTRASRALRRASTVAHIVLLWPLPALLGFHILSVYYF